MYETPLTDEQVRELAKKYMQNPGIRSAMNAFRMTEEEYVASLRSLYPVPTRTASNGDGTIQLARTYGV